ncbi:MAG: ABC transporter ATP-binding protein [Bdellovibrionaceae bacterium]|jgi:putative ABC transport system ATP-binding protein|nr:ABC transporter ATP-binding protein [Pseudobdellovibrionaceae bacterium]
MENNNEVIFKLNDIGKVFGTTSDTQVHALSDVQLEIKQGEFTAFVGPSGSGKSTLINVMNGFDVPTSGHVLLSGKKIDLMGESELANFRRDHIGIIFQSYNLIPVLTAKENIEYVMILQGIGEEERSKRVKEFLSIVGLEGKEDRYPSQLSGGQQQRVAVARAMVSRPDIVIADEPTANLDSKTGTELVDMMLELNNKYGTTFVFSTHDPMIMEKAKRLVTLKDGKVVQDEVR